MTKQPRTPRTSDIPPVTKEPNPAREAFIKNVKAEAEEDEKSPFYNMQYTTDIEGKKKLKTYPSYESFIVENDDGSKVPFKPASVAKWLWENEHFKTDLKTGILYFFDGRSWKARAEPYVKKLVSTIMGDENKENHYRNIRHALNGLTPVSYTHLTLPTTPYV